MPRPQNLLALQCWKICACVCLCICVSMYECGCGRHGGGTIYGQRYYAYFKIFLSALKLLKLVFSQS